MSDYLGMGISRFNCSMCGMCDIYPKWAWGTEFNLTAYLHAEKAHFP